MERRDDDRRPYRIRVYFWDRETNKRSLGYTTNISTSGMYITTSRLLPRGTRIRVALRSADDRNVAIEAVVASNLATTDRLDHLLESAAAVMDRGLERLDPQLCPPVHAHLSDYRRGLDGLAARIQRSTVVVLAGSAKKR